MPRVISVNNHRFPGPDLYYTFQGAQSLTGNYPDLWTAPSPGVLVNVFPQYNPNSGSTGSGYRYDLITNTYTTQTFAFGTYPNLEGAGQQSNRNFGYCSLGGGFSLVVVYDNAYGGSVGWVYNDATRTYTSIGAPGSGTGPPQIGLYQLGTDLAFLELGGTTAYTYSRITNTWSAVANPMPRTAWAGAYITDGLLYLAGRNTVSGVDYPAESFLYDNSTRTFTNIRHIMDLTAPFSFTGANNKVRSGMMTRLPELGVIGLGANNTWAIYNHADVSLRYRPRTVTDPNQIILMRPNPPLIGMAREGNPGSTGSSAYGY